MDPRDFFGRLMITFVFFASVAGGGGVFAHGAISASNPFAWNVGLVLAVIFLGLAGVSAFFLVLFIIWLE